MGPESHPPLAGSHADHWLAIRSQDQTLEESPWCLSLKRKHRTFPRNLYFYPFEVRSHLLLRCCLFLLQTGFRLYLLQLNSKDGFRNQCVSVLGLKSTNSIQKHEDIQNRIPAKFFAIQQKQVCFQVFCFLRVACAVVYESHLYVFASNKNTASHLGSFLSRLLQNKTTWRPGGIRHLASTQRLLIGSKTNPRSQLSSVSSELASEVQCSQNWLAFAVLKAFQEGFLQTGFKVYFVNFIRNYNNIACLPTMQ